MIGVAQKLVNQQEVSLTSLLMIEFYLGVLVQPNTPYVQSVRRTEAPQPRHLGKQSTDTLADIDKLRHWQSLVVCPWHARLTFPKSTAAVVPLVTLNYT